MERRVDLDVIGVIEGCDKSSAVQAGWDYLRHYESLFAEFRTLPINLIEIGVARGASIKLWKWFFSQAIIVGIDINPACQTLAGDRVVIATGSQSDGAFLAGICRDHPPTLVIDDGSHKAGHMVSSFEHIFPKLLPGGLYIVEDMALHAGPDAERWQTAKRVDAPGYFLELARACMSRKVPNRAVEPPATGTNPGRLATLIDNVAFIGSAVVIRKRVEGRDLAHALATADAYLAAHRRDASALERLATYILRHRGPLTRAEAAIDAAFESEGPDLNRLLLRAEIQLAQQRTEDAAATLAQAAAWPSPPAGMSHRLSRLQQAAGDAEGARKSAESAAATDPKNPAFQRTLATFKAGGSGGSGSLPPALA